MQTNSHLPNSFEEWVRQSDLAGKRIGEEKLFQIEQVSIKDPARRPEVVAICGKSAAQKLLASLAEQRDSPYRFAVTAVFVHPVLPGFNQEGIAR
jgi:hypothetical protein